MAEDLKSEGSVAGSNVFVSYSRQDMDFANQIVSMLEDEGYDPKIDRDDIAATEQWEARLRELISSSDTVVFVLSDAYLASENCAWEIKEAVARKKRLIPLVPRPITGDVPLELSRLNYIYFFNLKAGDGTGFYNGFKSLQRALRHDLERLRLLRRFEERAKEWKTGDGELLSGEQLVQAASWKTETEKQDSVPKDVLEYIAASKTAHNQRVKRERSRARLLGGLSIASAVATIAAIVIGYGAYLTRGEATRAMAELDVQTDDMKVIVGAAEQWASGRQNLALNKHEIPEDYESQSENATRVSGRMLEEAYQHLKSRSSIEKSEADHVVFIRQSVRRDLAKARFYNGDESAVAPIDENIAELTAFDDERIERFVDYRQILAEDYVSRAIYSCLQQDRVGGIEAELNGAPEDVRKFISWSDALAREKSGAVCEEARSAICAIGQSCDFIENEFDQIAMAEMPEEIVELPMPAPIVMPEPVFEDDVDEESDGAVEPIVSSPAPPPARGSVKKTPSRVSRDVVSKEPQFAAIDKEFEIRELYLHISDKSQYRDAEIVAKQLSREGFKVLGIDVVEYDPSKARSVRYYYGPQAGQSAKIAEMCAEFAMETDRDSWSEVESYKVMSLAGRYGKLPLNRAEIWF
ncbi:toll/interleukin-1 receptor domain-containing protein [Hirschia maritima]|uniref:toll/interleukin-1 receptor domain-containing protein n=1 Tax=Hirschia maritima TaxID=1121961 RepID=UPI0003A37AE5|nr:toll/interleukin-1 receptor domain-containing protein [Hirschia maritima]